MYWVIDGMCFCSAIAYFVLSIVYGFPYLCWIGVIWAILYPIVLQGIYNLASLFKRVQYKLQNFSRIVYSPHYNITFCGLQKKHPFDSQKYGNIYKILLQNQFITEKNTVVPNIISRSLLLQSMSKWYLLKLCYTANICSYIQMPLYFLPAFLLRWRVLDPMLTATQGTILSVCCAIKLGWAVNLSGGFHHASFEKGGGFCIYPDISLAVHYLRTRLNVRKVMIIDLDAHQGNGHERDHLKDEEVFIADFYNHLIYPNDDFAMKAIKRDVSVMASTTDKSYLQKMEVLQEDMQKFQPEFVIYNAGSDILVGDRLGGMNISAEGIAKRDDFIIGLCLKRKIPVVMLMSGGYQKINAEVIAHSIENLLRKYDSP